MQFIKKHKSLILLWICVTSTAPFIFYSWPYHPYKILTFACLLIIVIQMLLHKERKIFDFNFFSIIVIQIAYYLFITFYHNDTSYLNLCIQLISLFILISYINGFIGFRLFVKSYIYVIMGMGFGGTIIFFLHAVIGVPPLFSVQYSASGTSYFLWLTTSNVYFDVANIRLLRYSGFFDEPGTFALFSIFAILLNKIYFNNTKVEAWLIAVTIFTLSLAFYFVMFIYFLFFYINKSNVKYLFIAVLAIGFSYVYMKNNLSNDTVNKLYEFTFKRFELNDKDELADNNRADLSQHDKNIFYKYPILGSGSTQEEIYGSNLFSVFAQYGVVGSLFYYAFLVYFLLQIIIAGEKRGYFYFKIFLLILLNFYHRPEMSSVFTLLIFACMIYHIKNEQPSLRSGVKTLKLN